MDDEYEKYLLQSLIKSFGETDGKKMFDYYKQTTRHVKKGDNAIHLSFEGDAFTDDEVKEINDEFTNHTYQFSYVDESLKMKAHYDYQEIIATIILSPQVIELLTNSVVYPAIWDSIKLMVAKVVKRKNDLKEKVGKDTVCLYIKIKKDKSIKILLEGNVQPEHISSVMDKAIEFTKTVNVDATKDNDSKPLHYYSIDQNGNVKFWE